MQSSTQANGEPFSLAQFLQQADGVSLSVLAILAVMSLLTWYVLLTKLWDQWRVRRAYRDLDGKFWAARNLREGFVALGAPDNVFRMLVEDGARAMQHHEGHLAERIDLNDWMTVSLYRAVDQVNRRLAQGLAILATTGSVSPFVGLFGTVWGIYNALIGIAVTGDPTITTVSGPIGEALIMTAIGLFVAVPAVMGYNLLLRRNRDIQEKLRDFAGDLHTYLIGGARIDQQAPVARLAVAAR